MANGPNFATIVRRVIDDAQTEVEPKLDLGEVERIVRACRRFTVWEAGVDYAYDQRVVPAERNGRVYRVVRGGTSGGEEPAWPDYEYGRVTSGSVVFKEDGTDAGGQYDVRAATYKALERRYAKDQLVDGSADGRSHRGSQRSDRIRELMKSYASVGIA